MAQKRLNKSEQIDEVIDDDKKEKQKKPLKVLTRFFTVEPVVILHMTSAIMALMAVQDLLFAKACSINLKYSPNVCSALKNGDDGTYEEEQANIQKLTGSVIMWKTMLENVFPMILVCLVGAWSDKYGRKIPLQIVQLSFIIQHLLLIISAVDNTFIGANTVGLIASLIVSLAGSMPCFMMCIFSYVSDTTPTDKLTQKTAITGSSIFFGAVLGMALSGVLAKQGFVFIFSVAAVLEIFGFIYLRYGLPNVVRDEKVIKDVSNSQLFRELLNKQHLFDAVGSAFKKRQGYNRLKLISLLLCHACVMAPMMGENSVIYLFAKIKFNWDAGAFAAFMTYRMVTGFISNFLCMVVLGNKLKLSDPSIGIISGVSQVLSVVTFAYASSPLSMYIAPILALLAGSLMAIARSSIFKIVDGSETGKVNALIGSLEALTPLLVTPVYSYVYTNTFEYMPGAFFLLSAAFMVPPIFVYALMFRQQQDEKSKTQ